MQILSKGKAVGPDGISNKILKEEECLWPFWTGLFNQCLLESKLPPVWKRASLVMIPKSKGHLSDPKAWRGIALKCCPFKVLTSLIAGRIQWLAEEAQYIPEQQHGFVRGRSTMTAVRELLGTLEGAWMGGGLPVYAMFVDFRAAFDRASRSAILGIVEELGAGVNLRGLLWEILQRDEIVIFTEDKELEPLWQTTGVAQGYCLNPLLFILLLSEFPRALQKEVRSVSVILYADDLVLYGEKRPAVQEAVRVLEQFCKGKGLYINEEKTVAVKFRGGARIRGQTGFGWGVSKFSWKVR